MATQARQGLDTMLRAHQQFAEAASRFLESDWQNAGKFLDEAIRGGGGGYNATLLLMRARCFQQRGQWADATTATT